MTQPSGSGNSSTRHESVDAGYFERRQLKRGSASWLMLVGLGVAYVISGDFAGWNFGLGQGGWGGMMLATLLMAGMYTALVFALAELASALPATGGGYGFARRAFGPWGGFLTGTAILIEYAIAPAAIAVFIGGYCESLFGVGGWVIYLLAYAIFIGLHLLGAGEALRLMFVITAVALIALFLFIAVMLPHFRIDNLFDIAPERTVGGTVRDRFLPFGALGIWSALPYAMWFFLAIEGVPLAAEETRKPERDLPRGLIGGMVVLLVLAATVLLVGPGGAGARVMAGASNPLVVALEAGTSYGRSTLVGGFVNVAGLAGLVASFFSIIFAYSRQVFALSRAGYLPRVLSLTSRRGAPILALLVPGVLGLGLSLSRKGDLLILIAAFGATLSYVLMMAAHITLRVRAPGLPRPYRTPGGVLTSGFALISACAACVAGFLVEPRVVIGAAIAYALLIAYFALYSRHHLVREAPEERFEGFI